VWFHPLDWHGLLEAVNRQAALNWRARSKASGANLPLEAKKKMILPRTIHTLHPLWAKNRERLSERQVRFQKRCYSILGRWDWRTVPADWEHDSPFIDQALQYRAAAYLWCSQSTHHEGGVSVRNEMERDWPAAYAIDGKPYRDLYETLLAWPGCIPLGFDRQIRTFRLRRPLKTRLEVIAFTAAVARPAWQGQTEARNLEVLWRSDVPMIRSAIERVWAESGIGWVRGYRKYGPLLGVLEYIFDYTGEHYGDLRGLARKSIEWHRELRRRLYQPVSHDFDPDLPFPNLIPFDWLPEGFEQLKTASDLADESALMGHCIGSSPVYTLGAHNGYMLHFHVEHDEERATCTLNREGRIIAYGPGNTQNAACDYARAECSRLWFSHGLGLFGSRTELPDERDGEVLAEEAGERLPGMAGVRQGLRELELLGF
jgi:hypothetical protein